MKCNETVIILFKLSQQFELNLFFDKNNFHTIEFIEIVFYNTKHYTHTTERGEQHENI